MSFLDSQNFETYVPVYDTVPPEWEEGRDFLVEHLKKISDGVNAREIGYYLDVETLTGKNFIPSAQATSAGSSDSQQYRSIIRKVVNVGPLFAGLNTFPHGVTFDINLTSIDSWVEATNSTTFEAITLVYPELVINGPNINITSPGAYDRAYFIWEFIQEL